MIFDRVLPQSRYGIEFMESNLLIQMYRITWLFFLSLKSLKNTLLQFDEMVKIL